MYWKNLLENYTVNANLNWTKALIIKYIIVSHPLLFVMWIHPRITADILTTPVTKTKTFRIGSRVEVLTSSSSENVKRKKTSVRIMPWVFALYVKKKQTKNKTLILVSHSHYNVILFRWHHLQIEQTCSMQIKIKNTCLQLSCYCCWKSS